MALVIPATFAHVIHSLSWQGDPEPMAVTYGVRIDPAATPEDSTAIATTLSQAFKTAMAARLNTKITHTNCEIRWQQANPPALPVVGSSGDTWSGTDNAANLLPQNCAYLVHKRTGFGGRGGRGRMYLPGCNDLAVDNQGNVLAGDIPAWNTALENWRTGIVAGALTDAMVLLHDSLGAYAGEPPYGVLSLAIDPVISTQRRRLRR